jgi:MATE family multidrug resistance protein
LNRRILRLAVPNILSNLAVPLQGVVDTALMGRMDSDVYIGAVGLGATLFSVIYWGFSFLRMGTTGLTAQAYGSRDHTSGMLTLGRALLVAGLGSILVITLRHPLMALSFEWVIDGDPEVEQLASQYFLIRIFAAPAALGLYAFKGWFLGMQNARFPLILTLLVTLSNVAFSFWFVLGEGMTSDGVALGTVGAQYVGLATAFLLFRLKYMKAFHAGRKAQKDLFNLLALRRFFAVNSDIFFRTLALTFAFAFFDIKSAELSNQTLAINKILSHLLMLMAFGVDGFAYAAESLVGRYTGSKDGEQLRRAVRLLMLWGLGLGAIFSLLYGVGGALFLRIFTNQPELLSHARTFLPWMIGLPLLSAAAFMWDGVYIGATATRPLVLTMLVSTFGVFLPVYYLSFPALGNHGLWLAMSAFMLSRSVFLSVLAKKIIFF